MDFSDSPPVRSTDGSEKKGSGTEQVSCWSDHHPMAFTCCFSGHCLEWQVLEGVGIVDTVYLGRPLSTFCEICFLHDC